MREKREGAPNPKEFEAREEEVAEVHLANIIVDLLIKGAYREVLQVEARIFRVIRAIVHLT